MIVNYFRQLANITYASCSSIDPRKMISANFNCLRKVIYLSNIYSKEKLVNSWEVKFYIAP